MGRGGDSGLLVRCGVGAIQESIWFVTGFDLRTYAVAESKFILRFSTGNHQ